MSGSSTGGTPPDDHLATIAGSVVVEQAPRPSRPHVLEMIRGPGAPARMMLNADRILIGRAPECDVALELPGISWRHLLLTRSGPEYACEDCDSTNGVFLNGLRIQSAILREGDQIQLSSVLFVYHEGA